MGAKRGCPGHYPYGQEPLTTIKSTVESHQTEQIDDEIVMRCQRLREIGHSTTQFSQDIKTLLLQRQQLDGHHFFRASNTSTAAAASAAFSSGKGTEQTSQ